MPALRRALAFPDVHHIPVVVGYDLHFHVPRSLDVFLQVYARIAECRLSFGLGLLEGRLEHQVVGGHAHALAASARRGFDEHRKANLVGDPDRFLLTLDQTLAARHHGNIAFPRHFPCTVLVPQQLHRFRRRADEVDLAAAADLVEVGVLRQKPVAGMNGLDVPHLRCTDYLIDLQIALNRLRRSNAVGFVSQFQIGAASVGLAVNGHRLDTQFPAGTDDPQGDLPPVRYQDSLVHRQICRELNG